MQSSTDKVVVSIALTEDASQRAILFKPCYETPNSAGFDLRSANPKSINIASGQSALIPTGYIMSIPVGYEGQVRPRSGLALKNQITVLNSPGTIDADYRGEVGVILTNHSETAFTVHYGDRIAQMVIAPVTQPLFQIVNNVSDLGDTERGSGGFGSTGVSG